MASNTARVVAGKRKHDGQSPSIKRYHPIEGAFGGPVKPAMGLMLREEMRAHGGRRGERDHQGNENGGGQSHGKLAKQPADDPPISSRGINTATSEMLMVSTVKPISCAPFRAAWNGAMPFSR